MSKYLPNWLKPKPIDMTVDYRTAYKVKIKFGMLGPVGGGKSTIAAAFLYMAQTMSSLLGNFYCRCLPTSTHILTDANNLRLGHFPQKTDPFQPKPPEAGFLIGEAGWREKKVQVPMCDVAGEISDYIAVEGSGFTAGQKIRSRMQSINKRVVDEIKDCRGFITALPSPEALMFRESASTFDADVYIHNIMTQILEHRRRNKRADPNIVVVLTKWDEVQSKARDIGMDVYDESEYGMAKFLANGFPATSMLLKPLRDKGMVKFFRSWFNIKKREDGTKEYWDKEKTQPVINLIEDPNPKAFIRFRPDCSDTDYLEMVQYIGSFGQ